MHRGAVEIRCMLTISRAQHMKGGWYHLGSLHCLNLPQLEIQGMHSLLGKMNRNFSSHCMLWVRFKPGTFRTIEEHSNHLTIAPLMSMFAQRQNGPNLVTLFHRDYNGKMVQIWWQILHRGYMCQSNDIQSFQNDCTKTTTLTALRNNEVWRKGLTQSLHFVGIFFFPPRKLQLNSLTEVPQIFHKDLWKLQEM